MGIIGGALGGITSAIGSIASGNLLNQNIRELREGKAEIDANKALAKAHMENGMYAQPGQSASFNAAQTATLEALRRVNQEAAQDVTGGASEAAKAAAKAKASEVAGNMMTQAALQNEQQREKAYQTGMSEMQSLQQQDMQMQNYINAARNQKAKNIEGAAGGFAGALNELPW